MQKNAAETKLFRLNAQPLKLWHGTCVISIVSHNSHESSEPSSKTDNYSFTSHALRKKKRISKDNALFYYLWDHTLALYLIWNRERQFYWKYSIIICRIGTQCIWRKFTISHYVSAIFCNMHYMIQKSIKLLHLIYAWSIPKA